MVIPASKVGFYPLVRALGLEIKSDLAAAKNLVRAVLYLWQQRSFPHLALRAPHKTRELLEGVLANGFADWLAEQPFNDAAYWLASAYAIWVGEAVRTERALYFTPPKLAERVIDNLIQKGASATEHHWHDPACGGAAFLVPIAQRMADALVAKGLSSKNVLLTVEKQISGNDLDATLLSISSEFLLMALSSHVKTSGYFPTFNLKNVDGLLADTHSGPKPDVVACNPPYRKLNSGETKRYAPKFSDVIRNQPNVYGLFIRKTLDIVKEGGLIGLLTPTSFLSGASFSKLRMRLVERSDILQIDMLSDRTSMFISVEQETVVSVLKTHISPNGSDETTEICVLSPKGDYEHVGCCRLSGEGAPWAIPRSVADSVLLLGWSPGGISGHSAKIRRTSSGKIKNLRCSNRMGRRHYCSWT